LRSLGHADQDALDARAGRVQPELGAAIVDEVELDVASAAEELPAALLIRRGCAHAALEEGNVCRDEGVADRADEAENPCRVARARIGVGAVVVGQFWLLLIAEVVEEDAADPARLAAVRDVEVRVAPGLERRVETSPVRRARVAERAVEVHRVVLVQVRRREVPAAAEPPREHGRRAAVRERVAGDLEVADVHVHRRRVLVARVHGEREPRGVEREARRARGVDRDARVVLAHLAHGRGRERAVHDGDVHARLLEHGRGVVLGERRGGGELKGQGEDASAALARVGPATGAHAYVPLALERVRVGRLERVDVSVLQRADPPAREWNSMVGEMVTGHRWVTRSGARRYRLRHRRISNAPLQPRACGKWVQARVRGGLGGCGHGA
jgi:hypothetical protein